MLTIDKPALQLKLYNEILKQDLSVRRVEELARAYQNGDIAKTTAKQTTPSRYTSSDFDILKKHLSSTFNTQVKFSCNASGKGNITFPFKNDEELEKLLTIFDSLKKE